MFANIDFSHLVRRERGLGYGGGEIPRGRQIMNVTGHMEIGSGPQITKKLKVRLPNVYL